jgi:hypothetical protein
MIGMNYLEYGNIPLMRFLQLYSQSKHTLRSLLITNQHSLDIPVGEWPKKVVFDRCFVGTNPYIRPCRAMTEILVIRDIHRPKTSQKLRIDWRKFTSLRMLDLYVHSVDLTGIEHCRNLEVVRIDVSEGVLPDEIAGLNRLRFIATNCRSASDRSLHFTSEQLRICFIPKKCQFTSNSKIVPQAHLDDSYEYVNIQSLEPMEYV